MTDLATLQADLEALKSARRLGARIVKVADRETTYRNDAELQAQIAAIEAEIAGTSGPRTVVARQTRTGW